MRGTRLALGALMLSGAAIAAAPALADGMGMNVSYGDGHQKPCRFYVQRDLPAPKHCYRAFYDVYGPQVIVRGWMVFRDREAFAEFRAHDGARDQRTAEREQAREPRESAPRYAENTPRDRDGENRSSEPSSGGASYGHRSEAAESPSGGASY